MWVQPVPEITINNFEAKSKDGIVINTKPGESLEDFSEKRETEFKYMALAEYEKIKANIEETLYESVDLAELQASFPNIQFSFPELTELFPETPKVFTGKFFMIPTEDIESKFSESPKEVFKPVVNMYIVPGSFVTLPDGRKVYAKQNQGLPFELKEATKGNEYSQFKIYENYSGLIWEDSLRRDKANDEYVRDFKESLGSEYISVVGEN